MNSTINFLTPEECAEVDKALLTSHDKFTTRVAIYALRSLKAIAKQENVAIADLQPQQIEDWIYQDDSLQDSNDIGDNNPSSRQFHQFFSNLVISSTKPLNHAAQEFHVTVEDLTVRQLIQWFETEARKRLHPA
ncbi:MAG: hypothetical protein NW220_06690 [Leptolyngbyaceae cyanobacterium bins.349]|nr:hypothetical protein [Leptolyngbyaceae cyanobacterium bins.349]